MKCWSEAATGGVVIVPPLEPAVEAELGKPLAGLLCTKSLARHGWWRKLAPDKSHPQADPAARGVEKTPERLTEEVAAFAVSR